MFPNIAAMLLLLNRNISDKNSQPVEVSRTTFIILCMVAGVIVAGSLVSAVFIIYTMFVWH